MKTHPSYQEPSTLSQTVLSAIRSAEELKQRTIQELLDRKETEATEFRRLIDDLRSKIELTKEEFSKRQIAITDELLSLGIGRKPRSDKGFGRSRK